MRLSVESLRHHLDVFLWEHPDWDTAQVVIEYEAGGRVYARRVKTTKGFDLEWEELEIYKEDLFNERES